MKTTYLVWANPPRDGINPDWKELKRKEFMSIIHSPQGAGRFFVKLGAANGDDGDSRIVMETTEKEYRDWLKEKRHRQYLRDLGPGYTLTSYHMIEAEDEDCYGEEFLCDTDCDVEAECLGAFEREAVWSAVARLNEEDQRMIRYLYLSDKPGTERGYSALTGIPFMTVHDRKTRILKRLKNFLKK